MRARVCLVLCLLVSGALTPATAGATISHEPVLLARLGGHVGGFGGGGFRRPGLLSRLRRPRPRLARPRRGLFSRILHGLALAALFHFLFRSLGGLLVLILVVVLVVVLIRAVVRRRRRAAYPY